MGEVYARGYAPRSNGRHQSAGVAGRRSPAREVGFDREAGVSSLNHRTSALYDTWRKGGTDFLVLSAGRRTGGPATVGAGGLSVTRSRLPCRSQAPSTEHAAPASCTAISSRQRLYHDKSGAKLLISGSLERLRRFDHKFLDAPDDASGIDRTRRHPRHVPVAPERLRARGGSAHGSLRVRRCCSMLTGRRAFEGKTRAAARCDPQRRSAAGFDVAAARAEGARSHRHHVPRQGSGRSLADGARSDARTEVGRRVRRDRKRDGFG